MMIINNGLQVAGWSVSDLMRLGKKMPQAVSDYTDSTNVDADKIVRRLKALFQSQPVGLELHVFVEMAENALLPGLQTPYDDRLYLAALSIVVFHEEV
jgi:hypothetical protein